MKLLNFRRVYLPLLLKYASCSLLMELRVVRMFTTNVILCWTQLIHTTLSYIILAISIYIVLSLCTIR